MENKSNVGRSWDERCTSGESDYVSLKAADVENFRGTPEILRLVSLLRTVGGRTVLEAGCGSGKFSLCLATHGFSATAMDYTQPPLKNIKALSHVIKDCAVNSKFVCGDITVMPFIDGSYDMVFNEGVVEHWLDAEERVSVIREMVRVTRPGGAVAIYVPNGGHPYHEKWERTGYQGYLTAPPMTLYNARKLKSEMEMAGLKGVVVDGIQAFYSFNLWPYRSWLRLPIAALNRYFPLPKSIRCRWGVHLIGTGTK